MRLRTLALAFTLLAAPVLGEDLAGLWRVEGRRSDGKTYAGWATISPRGEHRWDLSGQARFFEEQLAWSAGGELEGKTLTLARRDGAGGAAGALGGELGSSPRAVYTLSADGKTLSGEVDLPGVGLATERYTRASETPTGRFDRARLVLRRGETVEVRASMNPAGALAAAWVGGARPSTVVVTRAGDRIALTGRSPGRTSLLLRLGAHGATLAALQVEVQDGLCRQVVARVKALAGAGEKPIVIFDLDDTLFDTRSRTLAILRTFPDEPRLRALALEAIKHGLPETLANAGYSPEEIEGPLGEKIRRHWSYGFFKDESLRLDTPIPGGVEFVNALSDAGAHVYYVTGRKVTAEKLSREVLAAAGFPVEPHATLVLKPIPASGAPKEETSAFKGRVTRETIAQQGTIVAAFDNEPGNCNEFRRSIPEGARSVFVETLWPAESPDLVGGIDTIPDFLD